MQGDPHAGLAELDSASCWQLLAGAEVGRTAVAIAGDVEIFPISFVIDHETIVFRTAEGTKFAAALIGTRVAFEADGYDPIASEAWSVAIKAAPTRFRRSNGRPRPRSARCIPGTRHARTGWCASCPPRSPAGDSASPYGDPVGLVAAR